MLAAREPGDVEMLLRLNLITTGVPSHRGRFIGVSRRIAGPGRPRAVGRHAARPAAPTVQGADTDPVPDVAPHSAAA